MDTSVRPPSVAGQFYPEKREELSTLLEELSAEAGKVKSPKGSNCLGIVVPHAGYVFSGKTAMAGYNSIKDSVFEHFILIGPKHTSDPYRTSIYPSGVWETPLGLVDMDSTVSSHLMSLNRQVLPDRDAHSGEHSLEVQLPFLQYLFNRKFSVTPILMGNQEKKESLKLANSLYEADLNIPIVVSTDLNHYESLNTTIRKDSLLIDSIKTLDVARFYRTLEKEKISACGYGPVAVLMEYTRMKKGKISLIDHSTSYHFSKDQNRVVGYASLVSSL